MAEETVSTHTSWSDNSQSQFSQKDTSQFYGRRSSFHACITTWQFSTCFHKKRQISVSWEKKQCQTCIIQWEISISWGQKRSKVTHDGSSPRNSPFPSCGTWRVHATGLHHCCGPPAGPGCICNIIINFLNASPSSSSPPSLFSSILITVSFPNHPNHHQFPVTSSSSFSWSIIIAFLIHHHFSDPSSSSPSLSWSSSSIS